MDLLIILALLLLGKGRAVSPVTAPSAPAGIPSPGPNAFPAPPTAEVLPASVTTPASSSTAVRKSSGVAPGTPEPGWKAYLPTPSLVVQRAFAVLKSGERRVKEADPTGKFSSVLYRREENPVTHSISVTAWRPANAANA